MDHEIFKAIHEGDKDAVSRAVAANPELVHVRNQGGVSALMQARYESRTEIVEVLRQAAGELDIFEAAVLGDTARVKQLLANDPELVHAYSGDGATALHFACFFNHQETANELLRQGSVVNAVSHNTMKVTPLHSAAAARNADLVAMILHAGANPNAQQQSGYTALHSAAFHGDLEMAKVLLEAGAQRHIRSHEGHTPADLAAQKGHTELAEFMGKGKSVAASK